MDEKFQINLLRAIAAETFFLCSLTASRELYGKSYFALGVNEKQALDQQVLSQIGGNFQAITPAWFAPQQQGQPVGFHSPKPEEKAEEKKNGS